MFQRSTFAVGCLLLCIFLSNLAHAEIYRWVDENGKVHFSDEKPAGAKVDTVDPQIADPAPEPDEGELRRRGYLESANRPRDLLPPPVRPTSTNSNIDAEQCRRARVEHAILKEPVPAYRTAAGELRAQWVNDTHQGSRNYIEDDKRDAEQKAAWQRMSQFCADAGDQAAYIDAWNTYVDDVYCDEHRVKLERARERRSRTPKSDLERMEAEYQKNC